MDSRAGVNLRLLQTLQRFSTFLLHLSGEGC